MKWLNQIKIKNKEHLMVNNKLLFPEQEVKVKINWIHLDIKNQIKVSPVSITRRLLIEN